MFLLKQFQKKLRMNLIHFRALTRRYINIIFSDKASLLSLLLQAPLMVIIICLTCQKEFNYYNFNYALFEITVIAIFMSILNGYREVTKERDVLIREYTAGLDRVAYIISKFSVQAIIDLLQAIVLVIGCVLYFDINYNGHMISTIFLFFLFIYITFLASTSIAIFISCIVKSSDSAILPVLFLIIAQVVLSGALMSLPENISFLGNITIEKWSLASLGHIFDIESLTYVEQNGIKIQYVSLNPVYEESFGFSIIMLVLFIVTPLLLSILSVRRIAKPEN